MPCVLALLLLGLPRLALLLVFLFSDYLGRAFQTNFWPFLGFFVAPLTTLAWAWSMNAYGAIEGFGAAAVLVGLLFDFGFLGAARRRRRIVTLGPRAGPGPGPRDGGAPGTGGGPIIDV